MNYEIECVPYFILHNNKYCGYMDINVKTQNIINKKIKLVIDISGSMLGERINQVKESYSNLILKLKNINIQFTLIVFNDKSELIYKDILITDDNYENIIIHGNNKLYSHGGTLIVPALELALLNKCENSDTNIIILTDGEDNSDKSILYDKFTNETLHVCGIGSQSLNLMNNISKCSKIKTINIIDKIEDIERVLTNLLEYMKINIPDNLIINNEYYQILNNKNRKIPLNPLININHEINIKVKNNTKSVLCTINNVQVFNLECINTELERLLIKFSEDISLNILNNNYEQINGILLLLESELDSLKNICIINDYNITTLLNYNPLIVEIEKVKQIIENISNDQYIESDIEEEALRQASRAITMRTNSLI